MSEHIDAQRTPTVFAMPEDSHAVLVQMCDHLRLMAKLAGASSSASTQDPRLRPDAMVWLLSSFAKELDAIINATWFSTELVNTYERETSLDSRSIRRGSGEVVRRRSADFNALA